LPEESFSCKFEDIMKRKAVRMAGTVMMVILGLLGGCESGNDAGASAKQETPALDGTIVALGDSLTAGYGVKEKEAYPARIERRLNESGYRWRIVNAGISGETSSETLARINRVLELKPAIVILEIGVNDGFQGIDPGIIKKNIEETVRILKVNKIIVVLAGMRMLANMNHDYNTAFAAIYPAIAGESDLILIPFFLEGVAGDPTLNKGDGIHPNGKGYRIVTETVYPYLVKAISSFNSQPQ
jgi:acyl-CoA thioesterase-1